MNRLTISLLCCIFILGANGCRAGDTKSTSTKSKKYELKFPVEKARTQPELDRGKAISASFQKLPSGFVLKRATFDQEWGCVELNADECIDARGFGRYVIGDGSEEYTFKIGRFEMPEQYSDSKSTTFLGVQGEYYIDEEFEEGTVVASTEMLEFVLGNGVNGVVENRSEQVGAENLSNLVARLMTAESERELILPLAPEKSELLGINASKTILYNLTGSGAEKILTVMKPYFRNRNEGDMTFWFATLPADTQRVTIKAKARDVDFASSDFVELPNAKVLIFDDKLLGAKGPSFFELYAETSTDTLKIESCYVDYCQN